jgi:WD40 repeat protein
VPVQSSLASDISGAALALIPGGRWLLTGDGDGYVHLWDLKQLDEHPPEQETEQGGYSMTCISSLKVSSHSVLQLELQADNERGYAILFAKTSNYRKYVHPYAKVRHL